jgi:hypothetical protein
MVVDDTDRFLRQALVCREEANRALSLVDAASWLRLADDFEKLAKRAKPGKRRCPPSLWVVSPSAR